MIHVRYKMNVLDTGKGELLPELKMKMVKGPFGVESMNPFIDYRDDGTVWVWMRDDLCVELSKELVDRIHEGFKDQ